MTTPLQDPHYIPRNPPSQDGRIPAIIEKWGPRSQLRWFDRFSKEVGPQHVSVWNRFYCSSLDHRGFCCESCIDDWWEGYSYPPDGTCCCKGLNV